MLINIGKVSEMLGVCITTIRRWEKLNKIKSIRTLGNHRRYKLSEIKNLIENKKRINIIYSRVSSLGQKNDLKYQTEYLKKYCNENNIKEFDVIEDIGSGINFKKKGLNKLIHLIINNDIDKIIISNKDRLLRFGTELIVNIANKFNTELIIVDNKTEDFNSNLVYDVLEIITVFSAKLYGKRSHKHCNYL